MRYVHEFVDELDCGRCPHNAPADEESGWGDFDFVCLALEDGDEFIFPEGCPAYLGALGAWRAVVGLVYDALATAPLWWIGDAIEANAAFDAIYALDAVGWSL